MDHERDFTNLNRPGNKPTFHIWKAVSGEIYIAWKEREDGAVLVNRIWVDDHAGYEDAGDHATPSNSKGLFDDAQSIPWTSIPDDTETSAESRVEEQTRPIHQNAQSADVVELKAKIKSLNKQCASALQGAAQFRKEAAKLGREKLELENRVQILKMQLAALSQNQSNQATAA
jgi:hypothetical protein